MPFILAHDLGTSGNKASLFNDQGALIASHLEGYDVTYPRPGWAEQDADTWWRAVCQSSRALVVRSGIAASDIAAITFSGQMMGVVAVDAGARPLRKAIIWADQRATAEAALVSQHCGDDVVYQRTGHRVSPAYSLEKILWLARNEPEIVAKTRWFLTAKDFVVLKLTDVAATDYSDASGSNAFDLSTKTWCGDFLSALEIDSTRLPRPWPSTTVVGQVTREASELTGLAVGTPVVIGGGDGACATIGSGATSEGDAYCVLGTSAWIAYTATQPLIDPLRRVFTFHNLPANRFMPTGTMQAAGAARDWLVRAIGEQPDDAVSRVPAGCDGLLFLPYLIGERSPWWNPHARAAFIGLTMSHGPAEMMRAMMEGVALSLRLILDALRESSPLTVLRLIGGGAQNKLWRQVLADALNVCIEIPELLSEATSWGAAVAGGVGIGLYPDWSIAKSHTRIVEVVEPNPTNAALYDTLRERFTSQYHAVHGV